MIIEKVKLTKVYLNDKSKDGKPLISSYGKPYKKIAIQTDKHAGYLTHLIFGQDDDALQFAAGQEVEIIVWEENGYKNFKLPSRLDRLEIRVDELEELLRTPDGRVVKELDEFPNEIKTEDLPF